jgi:osmotically-inducible protein OsmY
MNTITTLKQELLDAFKLDPAINGDEIQITVRGNAVILSGKVNTYQKKLKFETIASTIKRVGVLNNEITVSNQCTTGKCDAEILKAILSAIKWNSSIDTERLAVKVKNGWVTLEGEVEFEYQKSRIKNLAEDTTGVTGLTNSILVIPPTTFFGENQKANVIFKDRYYPVTGRISALR